LKSGKNSLVVRVAEDCSDLLPGDTVHLEFPPDALHFFEPTTGKRLS